MSIKINDIRSAKELEILLAALDTEEAAMDLRRSEIYELRQSLKPQRKEKLKAIQEIMLNAFDENPETASFAELGALMDVKAAERAEEALMEAKSLGEKI